MAHRPIGGRLAIYFLTDLVVLVGIVLLSGWIFQASANQIHMREALITQDELYLAIDRFTPRNLAASYLATIQEVTEGVNHSILTNEGVFRALSSAAWATSKMALFALLAAPLTLVRLYKTTSGVASAVVLAGYAITIFMVFGWLVVARVSLWRLVFTVLVTPLAVSMVFLLLETFMVMMLAVFFWFTSLALYTVVCPVVCTVYWVMFPNAERGITHSVVHLLSRVMRLQRT